MVPGYPSQAVRLTLIYDGHCKPTRPTTPRAGSAWPRAPYRQSNRPKLDPESQTTPNTFQTLFFNERAAHLTSLLPKEKVLALSALQISSVYRASRTLP